MKRIVSILAACLLLASIFAVTAGAVNDPSLPRVVDDLNLFSAETEKELREQIAELSDSYDIDIVILTTGSLEAYGDPDLGYSLEYRATCYADDYYDFGGYGSGADNDGLIFMIYIDENDPTERTFSVITTGSEESRFEDSMEGVLDAIGDDLSEQDYEGAAFTFLREVKAGHTMSLAAVVVCVIVGFVISLVIVLSMKAKMKNVHIATAADNYLREDTVDIRSCNVVFIRKSVTRTARQSSSSGGSSGHHTGSSGTSHGGGSRRF